MNSQDQDPSPTDQPGDVAPADDAIASPKLRRKRSPRVEPRSDSAVAEATAASDAAALPTPSVDEVFKPKRSRRKDPEVQSEPVTGDGGAAPADAVIEPAAKAAKPRRRAVSDRKSVV